MACKMVPDQLPACSKAGWLARWFRTSFQRVPEQTVAMACKMVLDRVPEQSVAMACKMNNTHKTTKNYANAVGVHAGDY